MLLPAREACFACGAGAHGRIAALASVDLLRCRNCGSQWLVGETAHEQTFWYDDPEKIPPLARRYYDWRARRSVEYLQRFGSSGWLVDLGCGWADFLLLAHDRGWQVAGGELDEPVARTVRDRTGLDIRAGDITTVEVFDRGAYDVVTLWGVIEHVPEPRHLLASAARLLRPGGLLILETPNAGALFRDVALATHHLTSARFSSPLQQVLGAGHVVWYSKNGLEAQARALGMTVADVRGSSNYGEILRGRWDDRPATQRVLFQSATTMLNFLAPWVRRPNQLLGAFRAG